MKTSRYFLVSGENENGKGKDSIYTTHIIAESCRYLWSAILVFSGLQLIFIRNTARILMFINNLILITLLVVVHVSMEEKAIFL